MRRRTTAAAILLGIGLGGFADGILLHQILQWHHMLSSVLPPTDMPAMEVNMLWDGIFHSVMWLVTLSGAWLLWSAGRGEEPLPGAAWTGGWMLFGWGLFNLVEGLINHQILQIHHVRYEGDVPGAEPVLEWELGFLVVGGIGFMLLGWFITTRERQV